MSENGGPPGKTVTVPTLAEAMEKQAREAFVDFHKRPPTPDELAADVAGWEENLAVNPSFRKSVIEKYMEKPPGKGL